MLHIYVNKRNYYQEQQWFSQTWMQKAKLSLLLYSWKKNNHEHKGIAVMNLNKTFIIILNNTIIKIILM